MEALLELLVGSRAVLRFKLRDLLFQMLFESLPEEARG
jgi:hypothetical protein